ncbi:MAG: hypothetical protein HGB05_09210 [Chloroflexi bacterium]|jgi:hypothetical protein|nr:hypothetical protein [Chloroflexota bacterium]
MTKTAQLEQKTYQIKIDGELPESWSDWFNGLLAETQTTADGSIITTLSGPVVDQAALHGILDRIRDLNLKLIAVTELGPQIHDTLRR